MATATTNKKKSSKKKVRYCGVCKEPGHNKKNCPEVKQAELEQVKRQSIVYDADKDDVAVLKRCAFPSCKSLVDETGYNGFCSQTHAMFTKRLEQRRIEASSKYKPEYCEEVFAQYILECERSHNPFYVKIEDNLVPMKRLMLPSVGGYANYLGVTKLTLKNWAMKYTEFRDTMLFLKQIQEMYLINNGVAGIYKEKITQLMLMNNHGMKDRSERTHNHLFGVVRRVYEKADSFEQEGSVDDVFDGQLTESADEIARDVK